MATENAASTGRIPTMATLAGKLPVEVEGEIREIVDEFGIDAVSALIKTIKREIAEVAGDDAVSDDDSSVGSHSSRSSHSSGSADYFSRHNSRQIQQAMLEASFDANFAVNQMGIIKHVNKAAVEQFGYESKEELMGQNINIIVGGGHAKFHDGYLRKFRETKIRSLIGSFREVSGRRKDGSEFPCIIFIEVIHMESKSNAEKILYFASIRDITKQKEAERLREQAIQEQKIRSAILDTAFDSMFAIDLEGTIQMVNKAAVERFGYNSPSDLVGQNVKCIVGGAHGKFHDDYLKRYNLTGETRLIGTLRELPAKKKDGTEFPAVIGIQRVERDDKNNPLMVAFIRDVSLQKKTEENQRIRSAILDTAFDPMFAIDLTGTIQMVNKAAVEQFGYDSPSDLVGQNVKCIVGEAHSKFHNMYLQKYKETGETRLIGTLRELPAKKKDGTEFPAQLGIQRVERDDKNNPLMVAFIRDISLQKKTDEDQRIRAAILDTAFDSMFAINQTGTIQMVNKAAVEQFGYDSPSDLIGKNVKIIVGEAHSKFHDMYLQRYKETGETRLIGTLRELPAKKKDGTEFPAQLGIQRVERDDKNNPLMVAFIRDISLQKKTLEDQRIRAAILDTAFDSMLAIDLTGTIQMVNKAAVTTFGYDSPSDLVGQNVKCIVGGLDNQFHDMYLQRYKDTGQARLIGTLRELSAKKKDGSEFPVVLGIQRVERDDKSNPLMVAFISDITLQKKTQEDQRIRSAILDAAFDSMFAIDLQGTIQLVNKVALAKFGYDFPSDLVGQNVKCIVGGDHAKFHDEYLNRYKETGETRLIGTLRELSARKKDGSEFPAVIGIQRVERDDKNNPLMVAFIRDITLQKKTQQDQKVRSAILDAAFDSMFAIDLAGKIEMVNKAALSIFGYDTEEELVGQNVNSIVGGGHSKLHDEYLRRYKETGEAKLIGTLRELSARRKDGTEFPAVVGIQRVERDDSDNPLMVAFIRDITKRKLAESLQKKAIRDQQIRAAILDASFDAMFALNTFGIIQMVNKASVTSFGYDSVDELLGKNIKMIVGGGHAEFHDDYLAAYRETGETHIIGSMREVYGRRKDGSEFPLVLGIERIETEDEEPLLVAFVRDMTDQKKATELEIEIRAAEELLCNMLPEEIASRLKIDPQHIADHHEKATILFADIVGFTAMSASMSPVDLVKVLNDLFTRFDTLVDRYGLNKVKTIGDCYMVTSIPSYHNDPDHAAAAMCHFSLDMIDALNEFNGDNPTNKLDLRVGINTGPVVAGVVGTSRFLYDLWGDSVNLASRMESTGMPSRVQVTRTVVECVSKEDFEFESRGKVKCKGKGLVEAFFLEKRVGKKSNFYVGYMSDEETSLPPIISGISPSNLGNARRRSTHTLQGALLALQTSLAQMDALNASFSTGWSAGSTGGLNRRGSTNMSVISSISEKEMEDASNPDL
ncbi:Receptor-type guanylate cyclase gcy [Seminavis robusta]|uniref:Receptor-type guanylate cyclase gcy n=1 Tax=Seminavis robusta TaxID=568900 RepID=A0A9N8H9N3_9STRA|nr:Receptor-type guanylate cyclase gcy [Seminavis robusta]|eukprot:Sro122_g059220.1 Receptor-type guanylate cyclase gcy (1441) ;mRNA; r:47356-52252